MLSEAVRRYRELANEIALVVLDLAMPQLSGAKELGDRFADVNLVGVLQKPYTLSALRHLLAARCPELNAATP